MRLAEWDHHTHKGTPDESDELALGHGSRIRCVGNITCTRDANGNVSTVTYDSTKTFPTTTTNPLGHVTTTQYYGVDGQVVDKVSIISRS